MSTPAEKQAATSSSDESQKKEGGEKKLTFDQEVNKILDSSETDDKGNIILPEDVPEELAFASRAEKRRRDTQSALAKTTSANAVLVAENEGLTDLVKQGKTVHISPEEKTKLDELKFSDPEAWREKMNTLEQLAEETIVSNITNISEKAKLKSSTGERKVLLDAFISDNPELVIDDDVLANDIPPRITSALEQGNISFIEFLGKVKEYLTTGKVIQDNIPDVTPNLSNIGGSENLSEHTQTKDDNQKYEEQMF